MACAAEVRQRVQAWRAAGWSSRRIAAELNAAGYRTPRGQDRSPPTGSGPCWRGEGLRDQQTSLGRRLRGSELGLAGDTAAGGEGPKARGQPPRPSRWTNGWPTGERELGGESPTQPAAVGHAERPLGESVLSARADISYSPQQRPPQLRRLCPKRSRRIGQS